MTQNDKKNPLNSIFDSLSKMEYDPELFGKALPCLTAIACALPPDYSKSVNGGGGMGGEQQEEGGMRPAVPVATQTEVGPYTPRPIPTDK